MTEASTRWACPSCLGTKMEKRSIQGLTPVEIDHCPRCGGVWVTLAQAAALRRGLYGEVRQTIVPRSFVSFARCHSCQAHITREAEICRACGVAVRLCCPTCEHALEREEYGGFAVDVCRSCEAVWLDQHELEAIWKSQLALVLAAPQSERLSQVDVSFDWLSSSNFGPDLAFDGADHIMSAVLDGVGRLAVEGLLNSAAVEAAGQILAHAAEKVVEAVIEIVAGALG